MIFGDLGFVEWHTPGRFRRWTASALVLSTLAGRAHAADIPITPPEVAAASEEGRQAIGKMKVPKDLKTELFAAEPMVANPVALCVDDQGRVYVAETFRIKHGIFDVRDHMDWLEGELASKSVDDRMALVKRKLGPNFRRETQGETDRIVLLEDTTGDGVATKYSVFADGFNHSDEGIGSSVLARDGNVYYTEIPNLWLLKDTTGAGKADVRQSLSYGYGVRYAFFGHDLHGLRFGPDGKLYFSIGDRAANVTKSVDGTTVSNTESGAVFRCNADGTKLELFATGLRNPQQLVFDQYGNLFTGDNNPDYGDPARWCYVVEGGDNGWRVGYQEDHNPVGGGPWMWESLWQKEDKLGAYSQLPAVGHVGSGPSGVAYYPGTGLPQRYENHLFMCDFHGGFTGSGIHSFVARPKGASFELDDMKDFVWDCLATDLAFAPGGGVMIADWVQGWSTSGKGRVYHVFDPASQADPLVLETKKLLNDGMRKRSPDELIKLMENVDMRVRQAAQFELADRGTSSITPLSALAATSLAQVPNRLGRIHAIWALAQIAEKQNSTTPLKAVIPLLEDQDEDVRAQAAKVLGAARDADAYAGALKLLADASPRVRYFAAAAIGKIGRKDGSAALIGLARANDDKDAFIRYAAVSSLAALDDAPAIEKAAGDESPAVRMAALLTMRRLGNPDIARFLKDKDPRLVLEAARAINDTFIEPARKALADLIQTDGLSEHVLFRVLNSNYRLGQPENARALAEFAARPSAPQAWRVEALKLLGAWEAPSPLDYVMNLYRPLPERDAKVARDAAASALKTIFRSAPDAVKTAAIELLGKLKIEDTSVAMELVQNQDASTALRGAALQLLADKQSPRLQEMIDLCLKSGDQGLRVIATRCLAKLPDGTGRLEKMLGTSSVPEEQAVYDALAEVHTPGADRLLSNAMDELLAHKLAPALELDVLEAAKKRSSPGVHRKYARYEASLDKNDHLARYRASLEGGDAEAGRRIFRERADVSCIRCHMADGQGGNVGPRLDGIAIRQNREYMLESIVDPNAKIAPGFESAIVKTRTGKTVLGVVRNEDERQLTLVNNDGKELKIDKADIVTRERGLSAMPQDISKSLTPRDIRNLVEFLASLKDPNAKPSDQSAAVPAVEKK